MSRTSFGSHWLLILIAFVALATIAAACGGSDDDDAAELSTVASEQSSDDEAEQSTADDQAAEQSEDAQGAPPPEQAEAQSEAEAEEDADAQADSVAEQAADEEQAEEQAEAEAEAEEASAQAPASAGDDDGDGDGGDDDGGDGGLDYADDGAVSSALALGDFGLVEDFRLAGRLTLDITPNTPDGDLALLQAFSDVTIDGAFVAPGDFELSIRLGDGSALPPIGLISVDDRVFANVGFGWEEQEGGAGALLEGFDLSGLGLDPSGLDLEGLAAGDLPFLPDDFSFDGWDDGGVDSIGTSEAARSYMIEESDLETFVERLLGTSIAGLQDDAEGALDLSALADASVSGARVMVWVDEETGTLAKVVFELLDLELTNIDDEGSDVSIGSFTLDMEILPAFGLPTQLLVELNGVEMSGPDGFSGRIGFEFFTTAVNQGGIVIEPPV